VSERLMLSGVKRKHLVAISSIAVGLSCAAAADYWRQFAAPIEMVLYSFFVFGPLFLGLWSERHRQVFWTSMSSAIILHGFLLYMVRSVFPFSTVLVVVPMALIEALALFVVMDKILGERSS
jgi:hypothetical protein